MNDRRTQVMKPFVEQSQFMNDRIRQGVEDRKQWARILVKDRAGNAVPGARLTIEQVSHEFKYGANLFMLDEMETPEKNEAYKRLFADCFNMATLPFYWSDLEPVEGKPRLSKDSPRVYRRPTPDLCLEYCEKNGITPKEHCLVYDYFTPTWVPWDVTAAKKAYERRFATLAERYASRIPGWEVINETNCNYGHGVLERERGYVEWAFKLAERYFPTNELIINEFHGAVWGPAFHYDRSAYYLQIERALSRGCRVDTIGMQFHMFNRPEVEAKNTAPYFSPEMLYAVMDQYASLGKPLQITELTIPAHDDDPENEAVQAEIIKTLYRIWFSHPAMEAIMYWNLCDGYAAYAPQGDMTCGENQYRGGLVRFDLTPKPAYYAVKELFEKEWHTHEERVCDGDGMTRVKGFCGRYEVTVRAGDKTITKTIDLLKQGAKEFTLTI